ncbi:MAG: peptidoglycan-binding domain-containing protein [Nodosilinea sp.]
MITRRITSVGRLSRLALMARLMALATLGSVPPDLAQAQGVPQRTTQNGPSRPLLRPDDRGEPISQLQRDLTTLGLYSGSVDGVYGPSTAAAVRSLQRQQGITDDGIAGPQTQAALDAALRQRILTLPAPPLRAETLTFTRLVVAQPAPPPSALWLALMPLVPIAGGALTYLHRRLQHQQVFRLRRPRRPSPPKPPYPDQDPR